MQQIIAFSSIRPFSFFEGLMSDAAAAILQVWGETHKVEAQRIAESGSDVFKHWQCQQLTASKLPMGESHLFKSLELGFLFHNHVSIPNQSACLTKTQTYIEFVANCHIWLNNVE